VSPAPSRAVHVAADRLDDAREGRHPGRIGRRETRPVRPASPLDEFNKTFRACNSQVIEILLPYRILIK
jgi:hypothetical protein